MSDLGDWEAILGELDRRRAQSRTMGGPERVARQHAQDKLDARQRIEMLFDEGTFVELGAFTGAQDTPADALVAGLGRIDGQPALAGVEDFTVLGGSIGEVGERKVARLRDLALKNRIPIVFVHPAYDLVEGQGGLGIRFYF